MMFRKVVQVMCVGFAASAMMVAQAIAVDQTGAGQDQTSARAAEPTERTDTAVSQATVLLASTSQDEEHHCTYAVYKGPKGTHHLAGPIGTAHYCWGGTWWIAGLTCYRETSDHWFYRENEGTNPKWKWAFSKNARCYCGRYSVWLNTGSGWDRFHCAHRYHPHVPPSDAAR